MRTLFVVFFIAIACWPLLADAQTSAPDFKTTPLTITTQTETLHFTVELALTDEQLKYGLMFRTHLDEKHGMVFVLQQPSHIQMWMKNTLIPLDMLFIAPDGTISQIAPDAKPESTDIISANDAVIAVIELPGGSAAHYHIAKGDHVLYPVTP